MLLLLILVFLSQHYAGGINRYIVSPDQPSVADVACHFAFRHVFCSINNEINFVSGLLLMSLQRIITEYNSLLLLSTVKSWKTTTDFLRGFASMTEKLVYYDWETFCPLYLYSSCSRLLLHIYIFILKQKGSIFIIGISLSL